jgi:hypothetical protein
VRKDGLAGTTRGHIADQADDLSGLLGDDQLAFGGERGHIRHKLGKPGPTGERSRLLVPGRRRHATNCCVVGRYGIPDPERVAYHSPSAFAGVRW